MNQATVSRPPVPFGLFFLVFMIVFALVLGWISMISNGPAFGHRSARGRARSKSKLKTRAKAS
jgi:hypothetical protein